MRIIIVFFLAVVSATQAWAERYEFASPAWQRNASDVAVVDYLGQRALRIKGGYATLKSVELSNGLIEFDMAVSADRGFSGAIFRVQDLDNYEHFYIRPHQSGNPDANQYTPVFNGVSAWQLYHGKGYGTPVEYRFDAWMHIKIAFADDHAEIFINSDEPVLIVDDLKRQAGSGGVGVGASNFAPAYFANFAASPLPADYRFATFAREHPPAPETMVMSWRVSDAFDSRMLDGVIKLSDAFAGERSWTRLAAENDGITNLARVQGLGSDGNTAIARLQLTSAVPQTKGLSFGYSDRVAVYVNGTLVYSGSNFYESRDYRYLGTMGLFDKIYLPLEAGENEVWFAVSEAFGGWGILAQFDDLQGLSIR
jgi:hypothetical protein